MQLTGLTWPRVPEGPLVLLPLGACEQHGPHLPVDTDTVIAHRTASRLAELLSRGGLPPAVVAPPLAYGASGEHQDFAGTASIGTEALCRLVVELVRSVTTWAPRVLIVNGHGGNVPAVRRAVRLLRREGHDTVWTSCAIPLADAHAGLAETSVMLHLEPWRVDLAAAAPGDRRPLAEILPELVAGGVRRLSPNGVLGDPTGATAERGADLFEAMCTDLRDAVLADRPLVDGALR